MGFSECGGGAPDSGIGGTPFDTPTGPKGESLSVRQPIRALPGFDVPSKSVVGRPASHILPGDSRKAAGDRLATETIRSISVKDAAGVKIGQSGVQVNYVHLELDAPPPSFEKTLTAPAVQAALEAYAASAHDPARLRQAEARVKEHGSPFFDLGARQPVEAFGLEPADVRSYTRGGGVKTATSVFVIENCQGVQMSDGGRQENHFLYIVPPSLDDARLLRDDADLRRALVEYACGFSDSDADLAACYQEAAEVAIKNLPGLRAESTQVDLRGMTSVDVNGGQGVTIGTKIRQTSEVAVTVLLDGVAVEPMTTGSAGDTHLDPNIWSMATWAYLQASPQAAPSPAEQRPFRRRLDEYSGVVHPAIGNPKAEGGGGDIPGPVLPLLPDKSTFMNKRYTWGTNAEPVAQSAPEETRLPGCVVLAGRCNPACSLAKECQDRQAVERL